MRVLGLEDFFAAGIGFDIAGASLVALGLLATPRQVADFMDLHRGGNGHVGLAAISDRIDAESGLVALVTGFLLQGCGYLLTAGRTHFSPGGGWNEVGVLLWICVAFLTSVFGARLWRRKRWRPLVAEVSHYDQQPHLRMPLAIDFRLGAFEQALGERLPFADIERKRELFGIDDYFIGSGGNSYCKASELRQYGDTASAPQYRAASVGSDAEEDGWVVVLRRVFGPRRF